MKFDVEDIYKQFCREYFNLLGKQRPEIRRINESIKNYTLIGYDNTIHTTAKYTPLELLFESTANLGPFDLHYKPELFNPFE